MARFTKTHIISEVCLLKNGGLRRCDSAVYQAWAELADSWFSNGSNEYHWDGFVGFKDRTNAQIIKDFRSNGLLID